jgi:hypothetical protein
MIKVSFAFALFLASGREVAYVDLTGPAKTAEPQSSTIHVRAGGGPSTTQPDSRTLPISVTIRGIYPYTDRVSGAPRETVEVVLTNTGKSEVTLPIGDDPVALLSPEEVAPDRRYLMFAVVSGDGAHDSIAVAESAANGWHPESIAKLAPGDTVVFRLPFNTSAADAMRKERNNAPLNIAVRVSRYRRVAENGVDFEEYVGTPMRSENAVLWP